MTTIIDILILLALTALTIESVKNGSEMCIGYLFITTVWIATMIEQWVENRKK